MKTNSNLIFLFLFLIVAINNNFSQNNNTQVKSISKQVIINIDDTSKVLKIKTIKDGNTEEIIVDGDDVDKYLQENDIESDSNQKNFIFNFISPDDSLFQEFIIQSANDENFEILFKDHFCNRNKIFFNEFYVDSLIGGFAELGNILKQELGNNPNYSKENRTLPDRKVIKKEIKRKIIKIENLENDKYSDKLSNFKILPVQDSDNYEIEFVSNNIKLITIQLFDSNNNEIFKEIVKIKGTYSRNIKLSSPNSFFLKIKQGKDIISKKIILEN